MLQIALQACDGAEQPRCGQSQAVISITRDQGPPFFINTPYSTAFNNLNAINSSVLQTTARDNDLKVSLTNIMLLQTCGCLVTCSVLAFKMQF